MTLDTLDVVAALEATTLEPAALPKRLDVGTDTRAVRRGSTFLALRGERFDGHAFVGEAFAHGAGAAIVADRGAVPAGAPAIVVEDTLRAYLTLAHLARRSLRGPVIAISGSAGKTTTKAYLLALLSAAEIPAIATPQNENNEIGVSRFLLGLNFGDERVAIVEMGARRYLDLEVLVTAAQPDVAILTNIGDAHLEIMGSRERLAHTKWGLFRQGAAAILNLADDDSRLRAATLDRPPVWFGVGAEQPPAGAAGIVLVDANTLHVYSAQERVSHSVQAQVPGEHNRRNLAAAVAACTAIGVATTQVAPHLAAVRQPERRYETLALGSDKRLIFDAYNASMSGTLATLAAFAQEPARRRIAVLGSMAELGEEAPQMHRRVGAAAAAASAYILAGGEFAHEIVRGAADAGAALGRLVTYAENASAVRWLRANSRPGDAILLKGSRRYRMEEIADALLSTEPP